MRKLTKNQLKIIAAISSYMEQHPHPPTVKVITEITGLPCEKSVQKYLDRLKANGVVTWERGRLSTLKIIAINL
ncbi:hypothetical protein ACFFJY_02775 [Fictibacillus aquaticus]|uniref:LexA repressor DNA-binding domain-containing protein n=1 Tax=Fictibacillus aquaticus TaxID=2021314 RepID=A0A235FA70_9BACL|nr:hypothetical protein [Fictibacillus aquaticus]OYD57625.1 hypothetical protein CGZ90_13240 [Fictibacillus aquaticus]